MSLEFYEKSHRYKLDGRWVPGVTTLVRKGLPNDALKYWSARRVAEWVYDHPAEVQALRTMGRGPMVAALKELPWQEGSEAAAKGTEIHAYAEQSIHGEEPDVPEDIYDSVQAYADWLDAEKVKPLYTETVVGNRTHQYGGKFDLLAEYRAMRILFDLTSGGVYDSKAAQLVGYEHAEFMVVDGGEFLMPPVDMLAVVQIQPTGIEVIPVKNEVREKAWATFQNIAGTANARKSINGKYDLDWYGPPLPHLDELEPQP